MMTCTSNILAPAVLPRARRSARDSAPVPVITGTGLVTALGGTVEETWEKLIEGRVLPFGGRTPVPSSDSPRAIQLVRLAADRALRNLDPEVLHHRDTALVVGTSKGTIDTWLTPPPSTFNKQKMAGGLDPAGLADIAADLGAFYRIPGPRLTVSAACASGMISLIRAAMLIRSRAARRVLVVASESSFSPLLLASYRRMGVLADESSGCRPFDQHRTGFLVSEAAAAVMLEAHDDADDLNGRVAVESFAMGGDATHLTGSDPDGSLLRLLLTRVIDDRPLDFIHAHGTGTAMNDPVELAAIDAALDGHDIPVPLWSHKGALGHSLGAAGLVSVVLSCMAHRTGTIPPNANLTDPLPAGRVSLPNHPVRRPISRSLAIAAGFGGATAVVSLRS